MKLSSAGQLFSPIYWDIQNGTRCNFHVRVVCLERAGFGAQSCMSLDHAPKRHGLSFGVDPGKKSTYLSGNSSSNRNPEPKKVLKYSTPRPSRARGTLFPRSPPHDGYAEDVQGFIIVHKSGGTFERTRSSTKRLTVQVFF